MCSSWNVLIISVSRKIWYKNANITLWIMLPLVLSLLPYQFRYQDISTVTEGSWPGKPPIKSI